MKLDVVAEEIHDVAKSKEFWPDGYDFNVFGNKLALVHSEVTEVLEALRKDQGPEALVEEIADIIVRSLDLYRAFVVAGLTTESLDDTMERKMAKNKERPIKHGNRF